jgi:zinc transporter ZupT
VKGCAERALVQDGPVHLAHRPADMPKEAADMIDVYLSNDHHRFGLQRMGLMTALAIGIHNFPEGLATFVAALADPVNGIAIAFAIALHNIPEGVCVAMPVYYATGSRSKAFFWAFVSGLSEPIGGVVGYLLLYGNRMSNMAYGVLFCLIAGMMVCDLLLVCASCTTLGIHRNCGKLQSCLESVNAYLHVETEEAILQDYF